MTRERKTNDFCESSSLICVFNSRTKIQEISLCAQSLRYLKSKYLLIFSAQWISRYLGRNVTRHGHPANKSNFANGLLKVAEQGFEHVYFMLVMEAVEFCSWLNIVKSTPILFFRPFNQGRVADQVQNFSIKAIVAIITIVVGRRI